MSPLHEAARGGGAGSSIHSSKHLSASRARRQRGAVPGDPGLSGRLHCRCHTARTSRSGRVHPAALPCLKTSPSRADGRARGCCRILPAKRGLLQPEVACHTAPFEPHPCCSSGIISSVLEAASGPGKSSSEGHKCPSDGTREGCPAPRRSSVPRAAGGVWASPRERWQCLQSQTRQRSYCGRSECKTGLVTSQI